jgi:hypothetical protein
LVLRYRERRVRTVALWLRKRPRGASQHRIESSGVVIPIETIALAELSASSLLANPLTVCFAAGADLGEQSAEEVCEQVAMQLRADAAGTEEWCMAYAAAGTCGRNDAMIQAMRRANAPLIIEDLVDIGFDEGLEKGRLEGVEQGRLEGVEQGRLEGVEQGRLAMARESVFELFSARSLEPTSAERARIESEPSLEQLKLWLRRAAICHSIAEVLD